MHVEPSTRLGKDENVAFRRLAQGEGGVLLHLESGQYHGINEVGCLVWELLDGKRTVSELVAVVRETTVNAPADVADQVIPFLESLRERGLVR